MKCQDLFSLKKLKKKKKLSAAVVDGPLRVKPEGYGLYLNSPVRKLNPIFREQKQRCIQKATIENQVNEVKITSHDR